MHCSCLTVSAKETSASREEENFSSSTQQRHHSSTDVQYWLFCCFVQCTFWDEIVYSETKCLRYANFDFPTMAFRTSAWKNTQQSKRFPASQVPVSLKMWAGRPRGTAVKEALTVLALCAPHTGKASTLHSGPSQKRVEQMGEQRNKIVLKLQQSLQVSEKFYSAF